ncbi:hypothetical protein [Clostridium sp. USBA 49]|uniref:hypothetical protein n=1 Tax=Clostridium sp. USBA 49 TaxID=1881060 RepID=UPI0015D70D3D|nr:hypothetical protein [Clostridium sp. USBA 49]
MASISCGISMCSTECLLSDVFIKENEYLFSLPIDINKYIISINSFAIINSIYYYLIFIIIIFINSLIRHINLIPKNAILIIPIIFFSLSLGNFITVVNIKRIIFADKDFKNVAKFFKDLLLRFVSVVPNIIIVLLISIYSEKQNIIMVFILFCLSSILMYYLSIITLSKKLKKQDEFLEKLFE